MNVAHASSNLALHDGGGETYIILHLGTNIRTLLHLMPPSEQNTPIENPTPLPVKDVAMILMFLNGQTAIILCLKIIMAVT